MVDFPETLLFSGVMGLSIFISLPIVLHKRTGERSSRILTAIAIGILIFLMGDIFGDVAPLTDARQLVDLGFYRLLDADGAASELLRLIASEHNLARTQFHHRCHPDVVHA
jgi:hypothetical protein